MAVVPHRCPHDRIIWWSGQWEPGDPLVLPSAEPCADCEPAEAVKRLSGLGQAGPGGAVEAECRQDQPEPCNTAAPTNCPYCWLAIGADDPNVIVVGRSRWHAPCRMEHLHPLPASPSLLTDRLGDGGDSDSDSNSPPESPS